MGLKLCHFLQNPKSQETLPLLREMPTNLSSLKLCHLLLTPNNQTTSLLLRETLTDLSSLKLCHLLQNPKSQETSPLSKETLTDLNLPKFHQLTHQLSNKLPQVTSTLLTRKPLTLLLFKLENSPKNPPP